MKHYFFQIFLALDQLCCTVIGGWADETMSSYAWRLQQQGKLWGRLWCPTIDWLAKKVIDQDGHCKRSYEAERARAQFPPELRKDSK